MRRLAVLALMLALLAGCAGSGTLVAVLPPEDGQSVGGVQVLDEGGTVLETVDQANTQAVARRGSIRKSDAGDIAAIAAALEATLPARPIVFTLYFAQGSTQLTDGSGALVSELFEVVKRRPGVEIEIVGHTDTMGEASMNDFLSLKRAESIVELFVQRGIDRSGIRASGRGEREPRVPTGDEVANSLNSRVEVIVR